MSRKQHHIDASTHQKTETWPIRNWERRRVIKAALQVLQERKVPMTCPEIIDVMATEGLWISPGGETPASTLYAAITRSLKDVGKSSPFRKAERGRFEAV